ncbi:MAG TPA: BrnA antitoxin family protein [Thermoanaerobaculia bacterium]
MKKKATSPQSQSDWNRVDRMKDEDIDLSDLPEIPPEKFARAIVRKGLQPVARKAQVTLRVDADVLEWFREKGAGYQSRMNAVLRAYKQAHER